MNLNDVAENGIFCDGDWIEKKDQDPNGDVRLIQLADIGDVFFRMFPIATLHLKKQRN